MPRTEPRAEGREPRGSKSNLPNKGTEMPWHGLIHRYRDFLPVTAATPIVTLNEGNTPLIRADRLRQHFGIPCQVYLKYEGANPTGSFKDRGMTLALS